MREMHMKQITRSPRPQPRLRSGRQRPLWLRRLAHIAVILALTALAAMTGWTSAHAQTPVYLRLHQPSPHATLAFSRDAPPPLFAMGGSVYNFPVIYGGVDIAECNITERHAIQGTLVSFTDDVYASNQPGYGVRFRVTRMMGGEQGIVIRHGVAETTHAFPGTDRFPKANALHNFEFFAGLVRLMTPVLPAAMPSVTTTFISSPNANAALNCPAASQITLSKTVTFPPLPPLQVRACTLTSSTAVVNLPAVDVALFAPTSDPGSIRRAAEVRLL